MAEQFDHENLDVYQLAVEFVALADGIAGTFPAGRAYLGDQIRRASLSISLNMAEGAGEFSSKEKARFYRMAKRSATECAACLDACRKLNLVNNQKYNDGRELLLRIVSMFVKLAQQHSS